MAPEITINTDTIAAVAAVAACFATFALAIIARKQAKISEQQTDIIRRQTDIFERQAFYQGQQTTTSKIQSEISKRQTDISDQQLDISINISKRSNSLLIMTDLFQEYRSTEFKKASRYVIDDLEKNCNPEDGYWKLREPSRTHVLKVSHFFNNIGALVVYEIVDEEIIIGYMGGNILTIWDKLNPFLENERSHRSNKHGIAKEYQAHFEDLVCRIHKKNPSEMLKKLQKISDIKKK